MAVLTDPISDFLTRFKNASRARKDEFTAPYSKIKAEIARILQEEGYVWSYEVDTSGKFPEIKVKTKFVDKTPALTDIKRVSKPGLRQYVGSNEVPRVL
ncbi:30S ribosomal protein S8, partial [Verrucomicrobiales bacterium]|nr:30S ribosomal protein S8 [Verrucomicrobiales bacterium]